MKYFVNVKSYADLKAQYRELLKANHPDNGGDTAAMQEINSEYDILFRIWKNRAEKENALSEEEKTETARSTRRHFYSAYGWEGSRYDSNLSLKDIAANVRSYVKEKYPTCKFSIRTKYASMCQELHVSIKEFPGKMYKTPEDLISEGLTEKIKSTYNGQPLEYERLREEVESMLRRLRNNDLFNLDSFKHSDIVEAYRKALDINAAFFGIQTEYFKSVVDDVEGFIASYNYDDSDSMTDYFDVNFYGGKVNYNSCKVVKKTARIKNKETAPAKSKEPDENLLETSGEIFTIEESKHTRTGEKIYLVKCLKDLTRDAYINLNQQIKQIGGYYSKFTHSFIFKNDPTEALKGVKVA